MNAISIADRIMGDLWLYNIENEEGILVQGKGNYCSKLKKRKLKTKKLLKITILGEQEHSVQSADRTKAVQV